MNNDEIMSRLKVIHNDLMDPRRDERYRRRCAANAVSDLMIDLSQRGEPRLSPPYDYATETQRFDAPEVIGEFGECIDDCEGQEPPQDEVIQEEAPETEAIPDEPQPAPLSSRRDRRRNRSR